MNRSCTVFIAAMAALVGFAAEPAEPKAEADGKSAAAALDEKEGSEDRWHFAVGPAWRATTHARLHTRVRDAEADGYVRAQGNPAGTTSDWHTKYPDLDIRDSGQLSADGDELYTLDVYNGGGVSTRDDTDRGALGLKTAGTYDILEREKFSVGARLGFAAYFNMQSRMSGRVDGARYTFDDSTADLMDGVPFGQWEDGDPRFRPVIDLTKGATPVSGGSLYANLKHDLYQISVGPEFDWKPLPRLSFFAAPSVLLNIAHERLDTAYGSESNDVFLWGTGLDVGADFRVTDRVGIYGLVGYEWIDKNTVEAGRTEAEVDYTSLVLSAGVGVEF